MTSPLPPKKDVALALIERSSVFVYLDPRREGVVTPAGFKREPKLVLQVGLNMAVPIRDLTFDDSGMSCTLSFNRTPFFCVIPWGAVFALTDENGQGMVWPDDVPRELVEAQAQAQAQTQRRAALRVVKDDEPAPAKEEAPLETKASAPEPAPVAETREAAEAPAKAPKKAKKASAKSPKEKNKLEAEATAAPKRARATKATDGVEPKPTKKARTKKAADPAPEAAPAKAAKKAPAAAKAAPEAPRKAPEQVGLFDGAEPRAAEPRAAEPPPAPRPAPGGKPKRELPPYLRVVK